MPRALHPLTDDQMARLVDLDAAGIPIPAIAADLVAPYFTVNKAVHRARERGWACPVAYSTCAICGRTFAHRPDRRRVRCDREECHRAYVVAKGRQGRKENPGQSTPYVRRWREENPGKLLAMRIRETDRTRGKPIALTPEQKARHSAVAKRGQRAKNERTRELADNLGQPWSGDEDRFILDHAEYTSAWIALELGRTYHGVRRRRAHLRKLGHPT